MALTESQKTVGFKWGTESNLINNVVKANSVQEGTFYLTTDSHRLYVGLASNNLAPVNEGVSTVETLNDLPSITSQGDLHAGIFYYVTESNILCVYNGQKWVQINPDTDTTISSMTLTLSGDTDKNLVAALTKITDSATNNFSTTANYTGSNGIKVTNKTITDDDDQSIEVIDFEGDTYKIAGSVPTEEEIEEDEAKRNTFTLTLKSENTDNTSSIILGNSNGNLSISKSASDDNKFILDTKDTKVDSLTILTPGDTDKPSGTVPDGTCKIILTDEAGNMQSASYTGKIYYGGDTTFNDTSNVNVTAAPMGNGGNYFLSVYTKNEIDSIIKSKLQSLDAMRFKGTIGSGIATASALPNSYVSNGDTYKLVSNDLLYTDGSTIGNTIDPSKQKAVIGDLFIAKGTEDADTGYITSDSLQWIYVPSGDDDNNTEYTFKTVTATPGGFAVADSKETSVNLYIHKYTTNDDSDSVGGLQVETTDDTPSRTGTTTISHKAPTTLITSDAEISNSTNDGLFTTVNQSAFNELTIKVPSFDYDKYGHLTVRKLTEYKVLDSIPDLYTNAEMESDVNKANVTLTLTDGLSSNLITSTGTIQIESSSLVITASNTTDNLTGVVGIDMCWGTF